MAVTGAAAYKEFDKVQDDLGQSVSKSADRNAANARQQKALDAAEDARNQKRLEKAFDRSEIDTKTLQSKVTGFASRDDVARDYAGVATQRSMEYAELARKAASDQDWKTHRTMVDKMNRIKGDFKNAVNDEKFLGDLFSKHQKGYLDGSIDDDDWLEFMKSVESKDYEIGLDENDNRVMTALVDDEKGGKKRVTKKMADIVNGNERPYEVVDVTGKGGLVDEWLVGFGKRKYDKVSGGYITTNQVWDDKNEEAFNAKLRGLQSNDRVMYSLLKQASSGQIRKKEGFSEKDKTLVRDYLYQQVRGQFTESVTKKVRSTTPQEKAYQSKLNRDITVRGQDIGKVKADKADANYKERLELDWWRAKNPTKRSVKPTKDDLQKSNSLLAFEIANKIKNAGKEGDSDSTLDSIINTIGDKYGLSTSSNSDWWGKNEFNLGNREFNQDDTHGIAKAIAKKMGYKYDASYAQEKLTNEFLKNENKGVDSKTTTTGNIR